MHLVGALEHVPHLPLGVSCEVGKGQAVCDGWMEWTISIIIFKLLNYYYFELLNLFPYLLGLYHFRLV